MTIFGGASFLSSLLLTGAPNYRPSTRFVFRREASKQQHSGNASFEQSMADLGFSTDAKAAISKQLTSAGFDGSQELTLLAQDFVDRPEVFSELLQTDFGFNALTAHRVRAAVMKSLLHRDGQDTTGVSESAVPQSELEEEQDTKGAPERAVPQNERKEKGMVDKPYFITENRTPFDGDNRAEEAEQQIDNTKLHADDGDDEIHEEETRLNFKQVVVNEQAKLRKSGSKKDYGLQSNYQELYPLLGKELEEFFSFMTMPSTVSQESPIRAATANVYVRHAKLFLGWVVNRNNTSAGESVSLYTIVPNKEKESADCFLEFVLWLRSTRSISVSYEANLLRGLTKLLKFRFAKESTADPSYGDKSFQDIPLIRELRKLHRDANKRQSAAPRSSDEDAKWLTWSEYLNVIEQIKTELLGLLHAYETKAPANFALSAAERKIATYYQYYLVLAFFACVPDRQRTIRELEIGKSFIKDKHQNVWVIKHGPDDYKTGSTYGERPPLMLSASLVPAIDEFIENWRSCLNPSTKSLFVQPRTGNPLTQDSVYQIVARNCYKCTGRKTNPHLLRDMIVTHVRDSDASEKQLEALALFMGHSIQMQRTSYDRRTLTKKVAPAVELLQSVNDVASAGNLDSL